jgi:hypothetical protein
MHAANTKAGTSEGASTRFLNKVLPAERERIDAHRRQRGSYTDADSAKLMGLALSGGGVRSAAFSFGVLAALKEFGVIDRIDYLSTVSGGGFIGSAWTWFAKNPDGFKKGDRQSKTHPLDDLLGDPTHGQRVDDSWTNIGDYIRLHGDYLRPTPRLGSMSLVGVILRNAIVSLTILGLIFAGLLGSLMGLVERAGRLTLVAQLEPRWMLTAACAVSAFAVAGSVLAWRSSPVEQQGSRKTLFRRLSLTVFVLALLIALYLLPTQNERVDDQRPLLWAMWWTLMVLAVGILVLLPASIAYGWKSNLVRRKESASSNDKLGDIHNEFYSFRVAWQEGFGRVTAVLALCLAIAFVGWVVAYFATGSQPVWTIVSSLLSIVGAVGNGVTTAAQRTRGGLGGSRVAELKITIYSFMTIIGGVIAVYAGALAVMGHQWGMFGLWLAGVVAAVAGMFIDANYSGLHRMFRDRLMEAFLPTREALEQQSWKMVHESDRALLSEFCGAKTRGPLHLLNTNLVLINSIDPTYRGRGGDNLVLSPIYCGGDAVNWHETLTTDPFNHLSLASAMAISGAAINPHTAAAGDGPTRGRLTSSVLAATNIRLGVWLKSPNVDLSTAKQFRFSRTALLPLMVWQLVPELGYTETGDVLELTDGGHFDNTAVYELLRRRVDTIVAVDAGMDADGSFLDLANLMERARLDFGIQIRFQTFFQPDAAVGKSPIASPDGGLRYADLPFAVASIDYPPTGAAQVSKKGLLLIIKPCLIRNLPIDIVSFAKSSPQFPHTTTGDQFFDESKFDAYRQLGYYLGKLTLIQSFEHGFLDQSHTTSRPQDIATSPWPHPMG